MTATATQISSAENVNEVTINALKRLQTNKRQVVNKAMELTDSWGQAMFIMDPPLVEKLFSTIGFSDEVCGKVFDGIRELSYVQHNQEGTAQPRVTWHAMDATCMTLRGAVGIGGASTGINDNNVEQFLGANRDLFDKLMDAMPDYAHKLMFSPEVAATVITSLGGELTADKIYDLASKYGRQVTQDLEGRRGVSTQFIRSLTLTISARANLS